MATTLPVSQATNPTGGLLTFSATAWASIPTSSFVVGRRYLVLGSCEIKGYAASGGQVWIDYNGVNPGIESNLFHIKRGETTKFTSVPFLEMLTVPAGGGSGLALRAQLISGGSYPGAEIRNVSLVAIDLDVNNTDFPQQSGNGWLYHTSHDAITLTTWAWIYSDTSILFTPDGASDYLVIASCSGYNATSLVGMGLAVDNKILSSTYGTPLPTGSDNFPLFTSYIWRKPAKSPTRIQVAGYRQDASSWLDEPRVVVLRLNTFTKWAANLVALPTVISGTSWQSVGSITPSPVPTAGDQFLILSRIQGYDWNAGGYSLSNQTLRNPGATQVASSNSANLTATNDFLGPTFAQLDTADGVNSYEQQFRRDDHADYPASIQSALLAAVKTEVEYTAPTKTYLPVFRKAAAGPFALTSSFVDYLNIPGYKFITGHRYVILTYLEAEGGDNVMNIMKVQFNGTDQDSPQTEQHHMRPAGSGSKSYCPIMFMNRITGTGSGIGFSLLAKYANAVLNIRNLSFVAIDLDVNNTDFPQESANGWLWAQNTSTVTLTTTRTPHSSVTFTPDGVSDYLVIGIGRVQGGTNGIYVYSGIGVDTGLLLTYYYSHVNSIVYDSCAQWVLKKPAAIPTRVSFDAYVSGGSATLNFSKLLILRLDTFVKRVAQYTSNPTFTTPSTAWQNLATVTPSPAAEADDQFLIFSGFQAYNWAASGWPLNYVNKRILRDAISLDTQAFASPGSTANFLGPMTAWLDTATGANSFALEFQRATDGGYPTNFYYVNLAVVSTEVKYTAPTPPKTLKVVQAAINGATAEFPQSPAYTLLLTTPGYKFVSGHRYLVWVTLAHNCPGWTSEYSRVQLRFNGAEVCTTQESSVSLRRCPGFMMAKVTGTGAGDGLQLYGQRHAISSYVITAYDVRMVSIDLDSEPSVFSEGASGWQYTENLTNLSNPTWPTYRRHSSLTFTPDGSSDYLVLADLVLYNQSAQYTGESRVRLQRDDVDVEPELKYSDGNTVGQESHLFIATVLAAPAAVSTTLGLEGAQIPNSFPNIRQSRIFVMRLNALKNWKVEFTNADQQNTLVNPNWFTLESGAPAPVLAVNDLCLILARTVASSFGTSAAGYRIRETAAASDPYASTSPSLGYGTSSGNRFPCVIGVLDVVNAAGSAYTLDTQNQSGYPTGPVVSQTLLLMFGQEFAEGFEDVAALGAILLGGSAGPQLLRDVLAGGAAALSGSAQPVRLVHPLASGLIEVLGSAGSERLRTANLTGLISVLGVAHGFTAEGLPLPSVARAFLDEEELGPSELFEIGVWGNDDPLVKNRLKVVGSTQLAIDAAYVPTGGVSYTFKGPASGVTNPRQLGFKRGDKIYLFQAQGEPAGLNAGKVLTIFDPSTLEVMEALTYPDGAPAAVYKFFAVRRGPR